MHILDLVTVLCNSYKNVAFLLQIPDKYCILFDLMEIYCIFVFHLLHSPT